MSQELSNDQMFERVFIGLGSNLGNRLQNLNRAVKWINEHPLINIVKATDFIETEPWGVKDQPLFLNGVVLVSTSLNPQELLVQLKLAEKKIGRKKLERRWGPRMIDLDILLFGDRIIKSETLTVPHSQLTKRVFVLSQLLELDEKLIHPDSKVPLTWYLSQEQ